MITIPQAKMRPLVGDLGVFARPAKVLLSKGTLIFWDVRPMA
jgi:hypothetical protein